jgi:hypothetical protein
MSATSLMTPQTISPEEDLSASHQAVRRSLLRPFPAPTPPDRWRIDGGGETIADIRQWLSRLDSDSFYRLAVAMHGEEWRRRRAFDLDITADRLEPVPPSGAGLIDAHASEATPPRLQPTPQA